MYDLFDLSGIHAGRETYLSNVKVEFWALGTYKALHEISGRLSTNTYRGSGTYTFHVGHVSELGVRDGRASPPWPPARAPTP